MPKLKPLTYITAFECGGFMYHQYIDTNDDSVQIQDDDGKLLLLIDASSNVFSMPENIKIGRFKINLPAYSWSFKDNDGNIEDTGLGDLIAAERKIFKWLATGYQEKMK